MPGSCPDFRRCRSCGRRVGGREVDAWTSRIVNLRIITDTDNQSMAVGMVPVLILRWVVVARIDVVAGEFGREQLSTGLVAVHRAGFGPHARVLDSARGALEEQLRKTGLRLAASFAADDTDTTLILITGLCSPG